VWYNSFSLLFDEDARKEHSLLIRCQTANDIMPCRGQTAVKKNSKPVGWNFPSLAVVGIVLTALQADELDKSFFIHGGATTA